MSVDGVERPPVDAAGREARGVGGVGLDGGVELVLDHRPGRPLALGVRRALEGDVEHGRVSQALVEDVVAGEGVGLGLVRVTHAAFDAELVGDVQPAIDEDRPVLQGRRVVDDEVLDVRPAEEGEALEIHPPGVALAGVQEEAAQGPVEPLGEGLAGQDQLLADLVVRDALVGFLDGHGDRRLAGAEDAGVAPERGDRLQVGERAEVGVQGVGEAPLLEVVDIGVEEAGVGVQVVGDARRQVLGRRIGP